MSLNPFQPQHAAAAFRGRMSNGDTLLGCFLALGSPLTAEIMAAAGYDWCLIDLEHGAGDENAAIFQMQAISSFQSLSFVRVEGNARQRTNRVLDLGAHGIMFPRVDTPEDALAAVAAMRYPPQGIRGVAFSNRACGYASNFPAYIEGSKSLITVVQIESPLAVANADAIAATDGVDVLFVGPSDLSHSLGILGQFDHPDFVAAIDATVAAAKRHNKTLGILLPNPALYDRFHGLGFRFIAAGNDGVLLSNAARNLVSSLRAK